MNHIENIEKQKYPNRLKEKNYVLLSDYVV